MIKRVGWVAALAMAASTVGCWRAAEQHADEGAAGGAGGTVAFDGGDDTSEIDGESTVGPPAMLAPRFVTERWNACPFSAPIAITSAGVPAILSVTADGVFRALDPTRGVTLWSVALTAPAGLLPHLVSPPAVIGHRVVFTWQNVAPDWTRSDHHVGVLDLDAHDFDPAFAPLTLTASNPAAGGGTVDFLPAHAYPRAAVVTALPPGRELGL